MFINSNAVFLKFAQQVDCLSPIEAALNI